MVYVVLLAKGRLVVEPCERNDVFTVARKKDAGICKVFDDPAEANEYVRELKQEQVRNRWPKVYRAGTLVTV